MFTTLALIPVGEGDEVATKCLHFTLYFKSVSMRSLYGQNYSIFNPWEVSTADQSWLYIIDPSSSNVYILHSGFINDAELSV